MATTLNHPQLERLGRSLVLIGLGAEVAQSALDVTPEQRLEAEAAVEQACTLIAAEPEATAAEVRAEMITVIGRLLEALRIFDEVTK